MTHSPSSIVWSIVGILLSGIVGAVAGRLLVSTLGLEGVFAALAAAVIAMVVATAVWLALTVALRKLGVVR